MNVNTISLRALVVGKGQQNLLPRTLNPLQVKEGKGKVPGRRTRQASSCGGPACHCPLLVLCLDPQTHIEIIRKHNG